MLEFLIIAGIVVGIYFAIRYIYKKRTNTPTGPIKGGGNGDTTTNGDNPRQK